MFWHCLLTSHRNNTLKQISGVFSIIVLVVGVVTMVGWQLSIDVLKSGWTGLVPVNPLSAVLFIVAAISALILNQKKHEKKHCYLAGKILAAVVVVIASLETMQIFGLWDLGLDRVLFSLQVLEAGNHMSPITAINFVLVGLALLVRDFKGQLLRHPAHYFMLLSLFLIMLSLLGYLYGVIYAYEVAHARYYPIALITVINFILMDLAVLLLRPDEEFTRLALDKGPAGITMRTLIPFILFLSIVIGWMRFYLQSSGIMNYELIITLTVTLNFFITAIVIWWNAKSLNILDQERQNCSVETEHHRNLLQSVISSVGEALVVVDQDYKIMVANKAAANLIEMKQRQVRGKDLRGLITFMKGDQPLQIEERMESILSQQGKSLVVDLRDNVFIKTRTGRSFPIAGVIAPLQGGGNIHGYVAAFRDISTDKEIDIAKTEFVSLASHQLRTPLSTINWYTEMLLNGDAGKMESTQSEYMKEIMHANKRMISLVNSLLNVSQVELGTFSSTSQSVNPVKVARIVLGELGASIQEKKLVIDEQYQHIPPITADPNHIKIIFQNLISNAVNYSPPGGKITVVVGKRKNELHIMIADKGPGIPKEARSRVFLKLFRADNVKDTNPEGTGLGLYLVKLIVDKAGGRIRFETKEGTGTSFFVILPYVTGERRKIQNNK